jgi:hypothetical protein
MIDVVYGLFAGLLTLSSLIVDSGTRLQLKSSMTT